MGATDQLRSRTRISGHDAVLMGRRGAVPDGEGNVLHAGNVMSLSIEARDMAGLLANPAGVETLSAVTGCSLVVVEVADSSAGQALAGLDLMAVPSVVAVVARDPGCLPPDGFGAADLILTEDAGAAAPFVAPRDGIEAALTRLSGTVGECPVAAASLALLLRSAAGLPVPAGLIAESAAYSALQAGAEFRRWRAAHPPRPPEPGADRIRLEQGPGELRIILTRPARRNAIDWRMRDALADALATAAADPDLRVVLSGEGQDFCAGGDLDEFGSRPDPALAHLIRLTRSPASLMHRLTARATVYLHGACLGAGIELPAFAGMVRASPDALIGLPEIRLGLIPGAGGTVSLPRRIGRWRTAFLALTGIAIQAEQALEWGLIDVIDPDSAGSSPGQPNRATP
jgi:enoyl-CoA hydratase/carnithine racemase